MPTTPSSSIREPGATLRGARPAGQRTDDMPQDPRHTDAETRLTPPSRAAGPRPTAGSQAPRRRADPNPLRLMLGIAGLASAAAFTTAMLPSITPAAVAIDTTAALDPGAVDPNAVGAPEPSVRHVTRYVTLQAGQTAPPQSTVIVRPQPTPRVTVKTVVKTRQSGKP